MNFKLQLKLTLDKRSGLTIDYYTSGENKAAANSPDRSGYPTAGLEGWRVKGLALA